MLLLESLKMDLPVWVRKKVILGKLWENRQVLYPDFQYSDLNTLLLLQKNIRFLQVPKPQSPEKVSFQQKTKSVLMNYFITFFCFSCVDVGLADVPSVPEEGQTDMCVESFRILRKSWGKLKIWKDLARYKMMEV